MSGPVGLRKYHGTRNDFLILDLREHAVAYPVQLAPALCDRHYGIGADGVLLVENSQRADALMRVINADGSEAEMCGNGIRCVARYLDERGEGATRSIETIVGIMQSNVVARGHAYSVRVNMGTPRFLGPSASIDDATVVDTGNPHVVAYREHFDAFDLPLHGRALASNTEFPDGANLHVAVIEDPTTVHVRHYERGVGETMACGTGAVACVVSGMMAEKMRSPVRVLVPGGELCIEWNGSGDAWMTGPAVFVFETTVDLEEFR